MYKKIFILLIFNIFLFSSCQTTKLVDKPIAVKNNSKQVISTETYIEQYKDIAMKHMHKYGIPASITLAQAILESNSGNSELAKVAKNHFGIKCTNGWKGMTYLKDDDKKDECFRMYDDERDSFRDHVEFLKRDRYAKLFSLKSKDYKGWAKGLKKCGYATNPHYPELLIGLIERYKLNQYDDKQSYTQIEHNKVYY